MDKPRPVCPEHRNALDLILAHVPTDGVVDNYWACPVRGCLHTQPARDQHEASVYETRTGELETMQDWQQGIMDERTDLNARIDRLWMFTQSAQFKALDSAARERIERQLGHMRAYALVLTERIEAWF